MQSIQVKGMASGKIVANLEVKPNASGTLMDFLMFHKIPIASSCAGAGTCRKCIVNGDKLSCQISLKDFIQDKETSVVEVTYL